MTSLVFYPDPRLTTPVPDTTEFDGTLRAQVESMFGTLLTAGGVGLAANQVGLSNRVFVIDDGFVAVNPVISWASSDTSAMVEGCLSLPGLTSAVTRPERIELYYQTLDGTAMQSQLHGLQARIAQHEIDHLNGLFYWDRVDPVKKLALMRQWKTLEQGRKL